MNLIDKYNIYIYERYNDLKKSQKIDYDNYDLAKIFEYYTAIQLYNELTKYFMNITILTQILKRRNK